MDNGSEFIAHALQEWCTGNRSGTEYIPPGSAWENPFVDSFNGRLRDEFLNIELFPSLAEAKVLAEQHRIEYNIYRPRSALQGRTPPGNPPAMEGGLATPTALIRTGATKGITSGGADLQSPQRLRQALLGVRSPRARESACASRR